MEIKIYQLHKKEALTYDKIEDKFAYNLKDNIFALADGASQKFQSGIWAGLLTQDFLLQPNFEKAAFKERIVQLVEKFEDHDFQFSSNPAIRAVEKRKEKEGASSTFIGMKIISGEKVQLIACGDSNFFQFRDGSVVSSFPYPNEKELNNNNDFFNTVRLKNGDDRQHNIKATSIDVKPGDALVLATDALSSLIFRKPGIIEEVAGTGDFRQFKSFCETHWDSKTLTEDDITAIIIKVSDKNTSRVVAPPRDFSFPPIIYPTSNQNRNMQEINTKLNQIDKSLRDLERMQNQNNLKTKKRHRRIISILVISILMNIILILQTINVTRKTIRPVDSKLDSLINVTRHLKQSPQSQKKDIQKTTIMNDIRNPTQNNNSGFEGAVEDSE